MSWVKRCFGWACAMCFGLALALAPQAVLAQTVPALPDFVEDVDVAGHVELIGEQLSAPVIVGLAFAVGVAAIFIGYRLFKRFTARA